MSVAAELYDDSITMGTALAPQSAIATPHLVARGDVDPSHFEPLETMAEAALALATGDPSILTGQNTRAAWSCSSS